MADNKMTSEEIVKHHQKLKRVFAKGRYDYDLITLNQFSEVEWISSKFLIDCIMDLIHRTEIHPADDEGGLMFLQQLKNKVEQL